MYQLTNAKNLLIGVCLTGILLFGSIPVSVCADSTSQPIVLSTAQDLIDFSKSVDEGNTYDNKTVILANDIDLNGEEFTPIGRFGASSYFKGVFDGRGYAIYGLSITDETKEENNALFGHLGGTVRNLSVYGFVQGNCCGGIASHIAGHAVILNCSTFVTIDANRGGGIGDNIATADVIGCYSACTDAEGNPLPLVSYDANRIFLCAATGPMTASPRPDLISGSIENQPQDTLLDDFLNENVRVLSLCGYEDLSLWENNAPISSFYEYTPSLKGKGTKSAPYLIETAEDFAAFRTLVNRGEVFYKQYFLQTTDIDLSYTRKTGEIFPLEQLPIGFSDTDCTFDGYYDGGGHALLNYVSTSLSHGSKNALFGNLSGIVKNLGLESGFIQGSFVASFGITATSRKATFVNCYSKLDLSGSVRTSAFADNFVGLIVGCFYLNEGGDFPMAAYNTTTLAYCYNTGDTVIEEGTSEFEPIECYALPFDRLSGEIDSLVKSNLPAAAEISGVKLFSLCHMGKDGFSGKVMPGDYALTTLLVYYSYEFLAIAGVAFAILLLIVCRDRRKS